MDNCAGARQDLTVRRIFKRRNSVWQRRRRHVAGMTNQKQRSFSQTSGGFDRIAIEVLRYPIRRRAEREYDWWRAAVKKFRQTTRHFLLTKKVSPIIERKSRHN